MGIVFYSIGDWGKLGPGLSATSKSMGLMSDVVKPDFILSLGDNFYPDGVENTTDLQWEYTYSQVFTHPNLFCEWYSILGNHDYILNPQAQIDYYLQKKDTRWIMPSRYYYVIKTFGTKTLQIVCLDTVELDVITSLYLLPKHVTHRENLFQSKSDKQLNWLEDVLAKSKADWLILIGHYNMYTGGYHGSNRNLINLLKPLFIKYKVDMYICGHCHNLEHLSDSGVEYVISGSGAKKGQTSQTYQTKFNSETNGYTIHKIDNNILKTTFIDSLTSKELYSFDIVQKRNL